MVLDRVPTVVRFGVPVRPSPASPRQLKHMGSAREYQRQLVPLADRDNQQVSLTRTALWIRRGVLLSSE